MSSTTTNLGLYKPDLSDTVNTTIPQLSSNFDKIDSSLADMAKDAKQLGCKGDGVTDDTTAIQSIFNNSNDGDTLLFPAGTYIVSSPITINKNVTIIGHYGYTTLKIANNVARFSAILTTGSTVKQFVVMGINFDMNVQNTTAYTSADYSHGSYNDAIFISSSVSERLEIRSCKFINLYTYAIELYNVSAPVIRIADNYFSSPSQSQDLMLSHIHLQSMTSTGNIIIEGNVFDNVQPTSQAYGVNAIFASSVNQKLKINKNKFNWCGRDNTGAHRLLAVDFYSDVQFATISDNVFDNCLWGFLRVESSQDVTIERNKFYQTGGALTDPGIWVDTNTHTEYNATANVRIKDNEFYANSSSQINSVISVYTLDWTKPVQNVEISNNSVFGKVINFVSVQAGLDTVIVDNNRAFAYQGNTPQYLLSAYRTLSGITPINAETSAVFQGLVIRRNRWEGSTGAINMDLTSFTGTMGFTFVENNRFKGVSLQDSLITAKNMPVSIKNNMGSVAPYGINLVGSQKAYIIGNQFDSMDNAVWYVTNATNFVQDGNYYNGSPVGEGTATIAASGTSVTVNHNLGYTPTEIFLTGQGNVGALWSSSFNSSQLVISCTTAPAGNTNVSYKVK